VPRRRLGSGWRDGRVPLAPEKADVCGGKGGGAVTCPICGRAIGPSDSIVDTGEGWAHKACGVAGAPPRPPRPSVSDHTIESLTAMQARVWAVPAMEGQSYSDWISSRIAAVTQLLINDYVGDCRNCGAVPLREASDRTDEINVAVSR